MREQKKKVYCEKGCWVNKLNKYINQLQFWDFPSKEPLYAIDPTSMTYPAEQRFWESHWQRSGVSEKCRDIKKILGTIHTADIEHLDWAYKYKFDYFLTCDKDILNSRETLETLLSIKIFNPKQEISLIEEEFNSLSKSLDIVIQSVRKIMAFKSLDPHLLIVSPSGSNLTFKEEIDQLGRLKPFYSDLREERAYAFKEEIQKPILNSLRIAAQRAFIFPQIFSRYFLDENPMIEVVIKEMFTADDQLQTLVAALEKIKKVGEIIDTIEELKRQGRLEEAAKMKKEKEQFVKVWKEHLDSTLISKLGNFFYDIELLKEIEKEANSILILSNLDFKERLLIARGLQICGERSKSLSLYTEKRVGKETIRLLRKIRNVLIHFNYEKLNAIRDDSLQPLFEGIKAEIEQIKGVILEIRLQFESIADQDPIIAWEKIKTLYNSSCNDVHQEFPGLLKLLKSWETSPSLNDIESLTGIIQFIKEIIEYDSDYMLEASKEAWVSTLVGKQALLRKIMDNHEDSELKTSLSNMAETLFSNKNWAMCTVGQIEITVRKNRSRKEFEEHKEIFFQEISRIENLLKHEESDIKEMLKNLVDVSRARRNEQLTQYLWKKDIESNAWAYGWGVALIDEIIEDQRFKENLEACKPIICIFFEQLLALLEDDKINQTTNDMLFCYGKEIKAIRDYYAHSTIGTPPKLEAAFLDQVASRRFPVERLNQKCFLPIIIGYITIQFHYLLEGVQQRLN